jgi:hypothetical protein
MSSKNALSTTDFNSGMQEGGPILRCSDQPEKAT